MSVAELLICPASDPTGTPIETWTDEDFLDLRLEISLNDLGKNSVKIPRGLWEGSSLDAGESYYARVNVPYIEATNPFWGFWLIGGQFILVHPDERGGENVTIGGPGPAFILTKAVLNHEQWTPHAGVYVQDGNWYWSGKNYGQILSDLINEDAASNHPALDAMETPGWDATDDVDGNPWEQFGGIFSLPVGTNYLDAVRELQKADKLDVWVTPKLNLRAFTAYGRDLSGNSYGAGVVRFVGSEVTPAENHNILDDLIRHKDGGRNFSHVLMLGNDRRENGHIIEGSPIHKWVTDPDWSSGDAVHQGFMSYDTNSRDILERAGQRLIRRSKDRSGRMVECEVMPGQDEANGLYLPGDGSTDRGNYWIGDTVTFKTGGGDDFDLFNRDLVIAKIRMQLDVAASDANNAAKGLSWRTWIETGDDIQPSSSAASAKNMSSGSGGCRCIALCSTTDVLLNIPQADLKGSGEQLTAPAPKSNANDGDDSTPWGSAEDEPSIGVAGEWWAADLGSSQEVDGFRILQNGGFNADIQNVATEVHIMVSTDSGDWSGLPASGKLASDPAWELAAIYTRSLSFGDSGAVTFNEPVTARYVLFRAHAGGTLDWDVETFELWSNVASSGQAAPCGHIHAHPLLSTSGTHHHDTADIEGGGGGAPTTADYLVGTAQAGLSAEIVVGTTPGGELGNTWASPTVDATHSGSTHSAATDTHIADATDAHDASAVSVADAGGFYTGTDVEAVLQEVGPGLAAGLLGNHTHAVVGTGATGGGPILDVPDLDATGIIKFSGDINPSIDANQNDWNPTGLHTNSVIRVVGLTAIRNITGIDAGVDGEMLVIFNNSSQSLDLLNESASSAAANRIATAGGVSIRIRTSGGVMLIYNASRWRAISL